MKKLLVTGGVLFTIMPALGTDMLDLKDVVQSGFNENCTGDNYSGDFVSMQAVYLPICSAGQYLDTNGATIGSDGKITGASCQPCETGFYCPGTQNVSVPSMEFTYIGKEWCPDGWRDNSNATSITECYKNCGNLTVTDFENLHAYSGVRTGGDQVNYPDTCGGLTISACKSGYKKINLSPYNTNPGTFAVCDLMNSNSDCSTLGEGEFRLSDESGEYVYTGSLSCEKDGACVAYASDKSFVATLKGVYNDSSECELHCGVDNKQDLQYRIAAEISTMLTKDAPLPADGGVFCVGNSITIDWVDVNVQNTCVYGSQLSIPNDTPTPAAGYRFIGWKPNSQQ